MRHLYAASAIALALSASATAVMAQETTSSIRGSVTAGSSAAVGASVSAVHEPSGTTATATTNGAGAFNLTGLRPGGPYTVTVTAPGFAPVTSQNIFLSVGQPYNLPILVGESQVEALVVTAARAERSGPLVSVFDRDSIASVASVSRDIRDIARRDPFASFNPSTRGVSIAGQNGRTNRFSVDGVRFSDNFGLNQGGLPSARGPIPLDAIEQLSVKVAPYDVSEGDFQGGSINVVLRSGGNRFTGAAGYTYSNDSLMGTKSKGSAFSQDMTSKTRNAFLSGPIIKDKLFFAFAYEKLNETVPSVFGPPGSGNAVPNLTQGQIDQVTSIAKSVYGYDTLGVLTSRPEKDRKWTLKLDWNINDNQRLSYSTIQNKGETVALSGGSSSNTSPGLGLGSYATHEPERVKTHVLQLNSKWTNAFSTELRANYRESMKIPVSFGSPGYSDITVCLDPVAVGSLNQCTQTGTPRLIFGTEAFSQADVVGQKQYGAEFIARYNLGDHAFKLHAAYSRLKISNTFVANSLGTYYFDSLADFQARQAGQLLYQYSITGTLSDASASFDYDQLTFGAQDSWDVTPEVNVTVGVRADGYKMKDEAPLKQSFLNRYGFANNANIDGNLVVQPRVGLTWRPSDRLTVRSGFGLFNGGSPDVFVGNSFSAAGVYTNTITVGRAVGGTGCTIPASVANAAAICAAALNNVQGNKIDPLVLSYLQTNTAALGASPTSFMLPSFKLPAQWKANLSVDYTADLGAMLGDGWRFGGDLLYGQTDSAAYYTDFRLTQVGTAPDGRPIYADTYTNTANSDLAMKHTDRGKSLIAVARASKSFDFGLDAGVSYTYSDIKSLSDMGTYASGGSTASGTYGAQPMVDPNQPAYGTSSYEVRDNWKFNIDYSHAFFGDYKTSFNLFGELRSGSPYSLTMNTTTSNSRSTLFGTTGASNRYLLYVPDVSSITADSKVTYASTAVYEAFRDFVQTNGLKQGIIEKNSEKSPDYFKVDLHVEQELPAPFLGGARFKVFGDVENLLNLINSDWGSYRTYAPLTSVVNVACGQQVGASCARYNYTAFTKPTLQPNAQLGVWRARLGVRFEF
ncbi:hypothetical protein B7G68_10660 [Caulobacter segnis]|uniref:TonB-dependent receptor plug n=2 Tax=Caulobacter segnis TaxID=88688 RepID=D5VGV6_CAUST|nr:TonB-dependent receptor [Caulobacter segnis]ADG10549.1 TonB-dependent receptor plug [Caulobacter segnis ATCC 21756]AVQ02267.1 hypothetical protein B7G68_10660 [Caulobacter segnis]